MKSINDNWYIFLIAKGCFGEIVSESSRSGNAVGKNIFKYLKMREEEIAFFLLRLSNNGRDVVCSACDKNGPRAVFFFGFMVRSMSICIAVVPNKSLACISRAIFNSNLQRLCVSDGVSVAAVSHRDKKLFAEDNATSMYLSGVFRQIMKAEKLQLEENSEPVEDIRDVAVEIGSFMGVEIGFDHDFDANELYSSCHEVFDGRACAALIFVLAAVARTHSKDGRLNIFAIRGVSGCLLELSFCKNSDGWQGAVKRLTDTVRERHNLPISFDDSDGLVKLSLIPYYEDLGFVGVKENDIYFDFSAYENFF